MTCAVFCIGTELTRGELVNTNGPWLAAALTEGGFHVVEEATVDDDKERIKGALLRLASRHAIIVCTGGLGPTTDDLTTESVADLLGKKLVRDESSLLAIRRRFETFGRTMSESNAKQADFPEGATVLPNPVGTAPGFSVTLDRAQLFFMPGVPREMTRMFEEEVMPKIRPLAKRDTFQVRLRTFGWPESVVGERLAGIEQEFPGVTIGYRASIPEIEVKVLARGGDEDEAQRLCERAAADVRARLREVVFGEGDATFAGAIGRALRSRGLSLAIAESCTGGLVAHMLTREAGASDFLLMDMVTYANSAKTGLLGVDEELIRAHGAVSSEVCVAMAEGARRVSGADVALAITGIAGPDGGSPEKPVGTVFLGVATSKETIVVQKRLPGERRGIQTLAAYTGLQLVRQLCG